MAVDTRDERAGAILPGLPFRGLLPVADGSVAQADRQQVAFLYPGILATETVVPTGIFTATVTARRPTPVMSARRPTPVITARRG